jgi:hypothetical protein
MKLKLTRHFQDMMTYRGIDIEHVKDAVRSPDSKNTVFEGRIRVKKKIGKKEIEVIYYRDGFKDKTDEYVVITAYYL